MKMIATEQKVVNLRLPEYDSSSDNESTTQYEKVVEITMQIKKVPKLNATQRVKDAKKQAQKTIGSSTKKQRQSEVVEATPHLDVDMSPPIAEITTAKSAKGKDGGIKRPMGAYMCFNKEMLKSWDKTTKLTEYSKVVGQKWKAMSDKEKQPYVDMGEQDKLRYQRELEAEKNPQPAAQKVSKPSPFSQKMPSSQDIKKNLSQASKSTAPTSAANSQRSGPPQKSESPETKKPSLYLMFLQKSTAEFQAKHPNATPNEIRKFKNAHWATLSMEEKQKWGEDDAGLTQTKLSPPSFGKIANQSDNKTQAKSKPKKGKVSGYNIFYR